MLISTSTPELIKSEMIHNSKPTTLKQIASTAIEAEVFALSLLNRNMPGVRTHARTSRFRTNLGHSVSKRESRVIMSVGKSSLRMIPRSLLQSSSSMNPNQYITIPGPNLKITTRHMIFFIT